ncbi:hypothetical protein [Nocardiopsis sp. CA-288880]|uniref:hypothetical protein n=1 Tax=Nocardiopsis sp. CA-288880 TaxID=3239995 RepID=UPI003D9741A6
MPFPWLAGQRITAERLMESAPVYVQKTELQARTSTGTPTADPDLRITLDPGTYDIELEFGYAGTAGSGGVRTNWSVDSGVVAISGIRFTRGTGADATGRNSDPGRHTANGLATEAVYGLTSGSGQRGWGSERWRALVTARGEIRFCWAQKTSNAAESWVAPESFLKVTRTG